MRLHMQTRVMMEGAEVVAFDQVVARRAILTCTNNVTRGRRLGLGAQVAFAQGERLPSKGALSLAAPCISCVVLVPLSCPRPMLQKRAGPEQSSRGSMSELGLMGSLGRIS